MSLATDSPRNESRLSYGVSVMVCGTFVLSIYFHTTPKYIHIHNRDKIKLRLGLCGFVITTSQW